ncbi:MAG: ribosome assembly cofactor RimP [Flavobacteriales bacterium]
MNEKEIKSYINEAINGTEIFLVDVKINVNNIVYIEVDEEDSISIEQCAELSRILNEKIGEKADEYEINVSSPGLSSPLKVMKQYEKNIGNKLNIKTQEGKKIKGKLEKVNNEQITLTARVKEKKKNSKVKNWVQKTVHLDINDIKEAKQVLPF